MMGRGLRVVLLLCMSGMALNVLQAQDKPFTVTLRGNLTTGSQLFPNPNSTDEVERAQFFSITDIWGFGVELKYHVPETDLALGVSAEYLRTTSSRSLRLSSTQAIPIDDGYRVIPIEITGYFLIPISGPAFGVYMGGGGGAYIGRRIYRLGGVEAPSTSQGLGFGIHVLGGMSYRFSPLFSLNAEMKFRDLQFESSNRFSAPRITYKNTVINVENEPGDSRVHTDGIVFQLGAAFSF